MSTDDEIESLAKRWLDGESPESLAKEHGVDVTVIKRRIKWAKGTMPHLPWDQRPREWSTVRTAEHNSNYVDMKDGTPGARGMPMGSVVKARGKGRR